MSDKELKKLKALLEKDKKGIEKRLKKLKIVDFGDDIDSGEEEADETEEKVTNVAVSSILTNRLRGIDSALDKMEAGKYGVCENCGKNISAKLLEIDPESKLCQACKIKNG